jgi:hypothetical protein
MGFCSRVLFVGFHPQKHCYFDHGINEHTFTILGQFLSFSPSLAHIWSGKCCKVYIIPFYDFFLNATYHILWIFIAFNWYFSVSGICWNGSFLNRNRHLVGDQEILLYQSSVILVFVKDMLRISLCSCAESFLEISRFHWLSLIFKTKFVLIIQFCLFLTIFSVIKICPF